MFDYTDPAATGGLMRAGALDEYRMLLHEFYVEFARLPNSAFTLLEAFAGLQGDESQVTWKAFPRTANTTNETIDRDRFRLQDEYVEWHATKGSDGSVTRVVFTTEFPEYYQACAAVGSQALKGAIQEVLPAAAPADRDLFGAGFDPSGAQPIARARMFRQHLRRNPWNKGERGILCLTQRTNTLGALFNLVGQCAIPQADLDPTDVCTAVGDACGPERASDPVVCAAAQRTARSQRATLSASAPQDGTPASELLITLRSQDPILVLRGKVTKYRDRIRAALTSDRAAQLRTLHEKLIEVCRRVLRDEVLGVINETGDRLFPLPDLILPTRHVLSNENP